MRFGVYAFVAAAVLLPAGAFAQVPVEGLALPSRAIFASAPVPAVAIAATDSSVEPGPAFLKGRLLAGVGFGAAITPDSDLGSQFRLIPFFRNTPRRTGWGPSFGLSWYTGDLTLPVNGQMMKIGDIKVRPVMGGVGYSILKGRTLTTFALTGGYAFNRARVTAGLPADTTVNLTVGNAWVVRPNVGMTVALTRRLALIASAGYVFSRPTVTADIVQGGQLTRIESGRVRSDYFSTSIGAAYSIF